MQYSNFIEAENGFKPLKPGEKSIMKAGGYSMFPRIRPGDGLEVLGVEGQKLNTGQILVCQRQGKLFAHRIQKCLITDGKRNWITQGDSCLKQDAPVEEQEIIGLLTGIYRKGGHYIDLSREKTISGNSKRILNALIVRLILLWKKWISPAAGIAADLRFFGPEGGKLFAGNLVLAIMAGIIPYAIIFLIRQLVEASLTMTGNTGDTTDLPMYDLLLLAVAFIIQLVVSVWQSGLREMLSRRVSDKVLEKLQIKQSRLKTECLENPACLDLVHRARREAAFRPVKLLNQWMVLFQSSVAMLLIAILLLTVNASVFILVFLAVLPPFLTRLWFTSGIYSLNRRQAPAERESAYFHQVLTSESFARELRLFGFAGYFAARFVALRQTLYHQKNSLLQKRALFEMLAGVLGIAVTFLAMGKVISMLMDGKLSPGNLVLFFLVFQRGYSVMRDLLNSVSSLYEDHIHIADYYRFLNLPEDRAEAGSVQELLFDPAAGVEIENLKFTYPGTRNEVLHGIDMKIPAGKVVVLAGRNGSGKTTLVKLLCGLYLPDSGTIRGGGCLLTDENAAVWRKNIAAVFQDFALYQLTASENISLGRAELKPDSQKVKTAARQAGISEAIEKLPLAYATPLGRRLSGGHELSIGQWQKLAIARAFYRDAPFLILDEPSSAMDAETEMTVMDKLRSLAGNKTVLLISHRLSSVKWADEIYLLEDGAIVEHGSHNELMLSQGRYAAMYQALGKP